MADGQEDPYNNCVCRFRKTIILRGGIYSNDQECKGRQMKFVNIDKGIDA